MSINPEFIAEAGSNHNGDLSRACELIDIACNAGASSIKFQFIFAKGLYLPEIRDGQRTINNPVYDQRLSEEMSEEEWEKIWSYAKEKGINISASVFCERGIELLKKLGASYVKIASTDLNNHSLIGKVCAVFPRVIVSTGMASLSEIDEMLQFVNKNHPNTDLHLMHCVSSYPCPVSEANTQRVALLKQSFGVPVGYSDHTEGEVSAAMALVQGASFFEKHFTSNRTLPGFDHAHALEQRELSSYINNISSAAISLQQHPNSHSKQEMITKIRARRGIYAARDLPAGHTLCAEDLLFVRPSTEFSANDISELVGKKISEDTPRFSALGLGDKVKIVSSNWKDASSYWEKEMKEKKMAPKNSSQEN
ncbi:N-acetylneuraminate synthase family protein [Halomonas sp. G11]|uniref:N-acetylneuraminate synthase family protein n=1 Tax=Halomonas sp. G11 TaxID=1684425 RepID=UPI0009ED765C|nr:N-acetylneuraminate synthase family protein [Halomonas sp. G11]